MALILAYGSKHLICYKFILSPMHQNVLRSNFIIFTCFCLFILRIIRQTASVRLGTSVLLRLFRCLLLLALLFVFLSLVLLLFIRFLRCRFILSVFVWLLRDRINSYFIYHRLLCYLSTLCRPYSSCIHALFVVDSSFACSPSGFYETGHTDPYYSLIVK